MDAHFPTELLNKYLQDKITPAERQELFGWLQDHDIAESKELEALLEGTYKASFKEDAMISAGDSDRVLQSLLEYIQTPDKKASPVRRIGWYRNRWWQAAAVLVLVAGLGAYLFVNQKPDAKPLAKTQNKIIDVAPGGNRAVLKLADGRTIILDSATDGNLAQQGNTRIIKLSNGSLAYNAGGVAAKEILYNTISTPRGGQYQIQLPDGSKLWLNAASSVRFPTTFPDKERKIEVTGEVYAEVKANKQSPFLVTVNQNEIEVLGTSFNINGYTDEASTRTTLIEGSLRVTANGHASLLVPGEQALVSGLEPARVIAHAPLDKIIAWKSGVFNFNDTPFDEVMRQLARWYDIEVTYSGKVPSITFAGEIEKDLSLATVLHILQSAGARFRMETDRKLTVLP